MNLHRGVELGRRYSSGHSLKSAINIIRLVADRENGISARYFIVVIKLLVILLNLLLNHFSGRRVLRRRFKDNNLWNFLSLRKVLLAINISIHGH